MNRCPALHDPANHHTQCFRDANHDGSHLRYGDPTKPPIEWPVELFTTAAGFRQWIIGRIGL